MPGAVGGFRKRAHGLPFRGSPIQRRAADRPVPGRRRLASCGGPGPHRHGFALRPWRRSHVELGCHRRDNPGFRRRPSSPRCPSGRGRSQHHRSGCDRDGPAPARRRRLQPAYRGQRRIHPPARFARVPAPGNSICGVAAPATALHQPGVGAFSLLIVANAASTPALAAAQYLNLYVRAVQLREQAVAEHRKIQTRRAAEEAIEEDAAQRLQALRAEVVPLLEGIAEGIVTVDEPHVAQLAHRLAADLRRELVAARSGKWLLLASMAAPDETKVTSVDLLDPNRCLSRLGDADRAALAVLLGVLHRYSNWQRLSVALAPEDGWRGTPGGPEVALATATITVVATGPRARAAAQDPPVVAAARQLDADLHLEMSNVLVAETSLALTPVASLTGRHDTQPTQSPRP